MEEAVNNMVNIYLPIEKGAEVILVCDGEKERFARSVADAYLSRGCIPTIVRLPDTLDHEAGFLRHILQTYDASFLLLPSAHTWSTQHISRFLDFSEGPPRVKDKTPPCRVEVMPPESVLRLYSSDAATDTAYLQALKRQLPEHVPVRLTAPGGTDLRFISRSWIVQQWEVLTAPVEGSVEGKIVVDGSVFFAPITEPIEITIQKGKITSITSTRDGNSVLQQYRRLTDSSYKKEANRQLAEIGIGGNAHARISGVVMEDESVRGTCHFCFGNNSPYGGQNPSDWHGGTVVVKNPDFPALHSGS